MQMKAAGCWLMIAATWALSGCDQLGLETPAKAAERQEAEAKAIGGACRHALRAIEDCYVLNPKADKSAMFTGWREMDEYMRENKIEGIAPVVPRPAVGGKIKPKPQDEEEEDSHEEVIDEAKPVAAAPSGAESESKDKGGANSDQASGSEHGRQPSRAAASGSEKASASSRK